MAGRRLYITIPERDWHIMRRVAVLLGQCAGQWARDVVLGELYRQLAADPQLQDYDAELARQEREVLIRGR